LSGWPSGEGVRLKIY